LDYTETEIIEVDSEKGYSFLITEIKNILPLQSSVKIRYSDIPWSVSFSFSEAAE